MADASSTLARLDSVAVAAEQGIGEITAIAATIRRGEGTLGKLVRDDEAYDRLMALSEDGDDTLRNLEENLSALKGTWPISRYFNKRGFERRGARAVPPGGRARESRPGLAPTCSSPAARSLTERAAQLDEVARWFKSLNRPRTTEIVVAAYTDGSGTSDEEMAQALTQEQAEAVRGYLVDQHKIQSNGWLRASRTVAAVGFGTQTPEIPGETVPQGPSQRVEIVLFTPQA